MTPEQREALIAQEKVQQQAKQQAELTAQYKWYTDLSDAFRVAQSTNRKLLLNFTGSDWCGWCKKLNAEVFSKKEFQQYAVGNYVLVELDFPKNKQQSNDLKQQNREVAKKLGIRGYPTIIVLNPDGSLHARSGYVPGGPNAFLQSIQ